jgi:sulfite exporter TauE/SafE
MRVATFIVLTIAAIALGGYICIYLMLYCGILQAIDNWGVDNGAVVWGIIRAIAFECGAIPSMIIIAISAWFLEIFE